MTEQYDKENHWYGHNGGPCPVHPETEVEIFRALNIGWGKPYKTPAKEADWKHSNIIAFRITKLYREPRKPREWWIPVIRETQLISAVHHGTEWSDANVDLIHVREVLPEDEA